MKFMYLILLISTIIFAAALFLKILPYDICSLGIFATNGISYSLRIIECKKK